MTAGALVMEMDGATLARNASCCRRPRCHHTDQNGATFTMNDAGTIILEG
jgi:hypothetical protein